MKRIEEIADKSDMIINGFAFLCKDDKITIVNLHRADSVLLIEKNGDILETSMNDIEIEIALEYYSRNKQFLED